MLSSKWIRDLISKSSNTRILTPSVFLSYVHHLFPIFLLLLPHPQAPQPQLPWNPQYLPFLHSPLFFHPILQDLRFQIITFIIPLSTFISFSSTPPHHLLHGSQHWRNGDKARYDVYFEESGTVVPVTVIGFREGNIVTQVKTEATDGYNAVQVGYCSLRDRKLTKPEMRHLEKSGIIPLRHLQEFRLESVEGFEPNQRLVFDELFKDGDLGTVSILARPEVNMVISDGAVLENKTITRPGDIGGARRGSNRISRRP